MLRSKEKRSEFITIRARPSELRRIEAAAQVAGVSRSRLLREGALQVAGEILKGAADPPEEGDQ